jgi:hypothetical protein
LVKKSGIYVRNRVERKESSSQERGMIVVVVLVGERGWLVCR